MNNNQITEIPKEITELPKLERIVAYGNPIKIIPKKLLGILRI
jgi:Leucine-rich repeat (LRR) protein